MFKYMRVSVIENITRNVCMKVCLKIVLNIRKIKMNWIFFLILLEIISQRLLTNSLDYSLYNPVLGCKY